MVRTIDFESESFSRWWTGGYPGIPRTWFFALVRPVLRGHYMCSSQNYGPILVPPKYIRCHSILCTQNDPIILTTHMHVVRCCRIFSLRATTKYLCYKYRPYVLQAHQMPMQKTFPAILMLPDHILCINFPYRSQNATKEFAATSTEQTCVLGSR